MAHDVFISYASPDKVIANAVCARLEEAKIRCWIAPRDVGPGNYPAELVRAITAAKLLVVIVSQSANRSENVSREVHQAIKREKVVIPLRIEDVALAGDLEFLLDITHWLDAITPPLEQHIQLLISKVGMLLGMAAAPGHTGAGDTRARHTASKRAATLVLPQAYAGSSGPVYVAGSFNNWLNADGGRLRADPATLAAFELAPKRTASGQRLQIELVLPPGTYEFKFVTAAAKWLPWIVTSEHDKGQDAVDGANFRIEVL